jgi:hypothetical protein
VVDQSGEHSVGDAAPTVFGDDVEPFQLGQAVVLQLDAADTDEPVAPARADEVDPGLLQPSHRVAEGLLPRIAGVRQLGRELLEQRRDLRIARPNSRDPQQATHEPNAIRPTGDRTAAPRAAEVSLPAPPPLPTSRLGRTLPVFNFGRADSC